MARRLARPAALVAVALAAPAGWAALAGAGDVATFPTKVTISKQAPAFHGKVRSDEQRCVKQRKVKLLRRKRAGRPAKLLGTDRTDGRGRWEVTEPDEFTLKSGIYFARAPRKVLDATPMSVATVCDRDRSRKVVVD